MSEIKSRKDEIKTILNKHEKFVRGATGGYYVVENSEYMSVATEIEKLFKGETNWIVIIKDGWEYAGRRGKQVGREVFDEQWWTPVLWEDEEDPDFHKTAGLDKVETWKSDQIIEGQNDN